MNDEIKVLIDADGDTTGTLDVSSVDYRPEDFIGEQVQVKTHDENGNTVEIIGTLIEIL